MLQGSGIAIGRRAFKSEIKVETLSMCVFTIFCSEHILMEGAFVALQPAVEIKKETLILGYQTALIRMMTIFILLSHFPYKVEINIILTLKCYVLLQPKS